MVRKGTSGVVTTAPPGLASALLAQNAVVLDVTWFNLGDGPLDIDFYLQKWNGLSWDIVDEDSALDQPGTGGPFSLTPTGAGDYRAILFTLALPEGVVTNTVAYS